MLTENIKVSEVSEVLRRQLEGIDTHVQLDEVGTVLQVSDGVVRIYGLRNAEAGELLEFENGIKAIVMNLEEDNVGAVLLGPTDKIKEGFTVKRTKRIASIMVGEKMLGRVIDPLGAPLDGKGLVDGDFIFIVQEDGTIVYDSYSIGMIYTGYGAITIEYPTAFGLSASHNRQIDDKTFQLAPMYYMAESGAGFDCSGYDEVVLIELGE